ncbi:hypothetical protein RCL1_007854 [Eukaryota sp. TZLM3-RCL]
MNDHQVSRSEELPSASLVANLVPEFILRFTGSDNPFWNLVKVRNFNSDTQKGDFGCLACGAIINNTFCTRFESKHTLSCTKLAKTAELHALLEFRRSKDLERKQRTHKQLKKSRPSMC